jgi:hypothetical protein
MVVKEGDNNIEFASKPLLFWLNDNVDQHVFAHSKMTFIQLQYLVAKEAKVHVADIEIEELRGHSQQYYFSQLW